MKKWVPQELGLSNSWAPDTRKEKNRFLTYRGKKKKLWRAFCIHKNGKLLHFINFETTLIASFPSALLSPPISRNFSLKETLLQKCQPSQDFGNSKTSHSRLKLFLLGIILLMLLWDDQKVLSHILIPPPPTAPALPPLASAQINELFDQPNNCFQLSHSQTT